MEEKRAGWFRQENLGWNLRGVAAAGGPGCQHLSSMLRVGSNFKATSRLSGSRLRLREWRTRLPGARIDS